ncbi:MAG: HPr family phosphocarrier protein [Planctomycetota bacterium]|jgi:phosphocarrier protein
MSTEAEIALINTYGFHVRPASAFLQLANKFTCDINVTANGNTVPGNSAMGLISLGAAKGDSITISCSGDDEEEALKSLIDLVKSSFNGID